MCLRVTGSRYTLGPLLPRQNIIILLATQTLAIFRPITLEDGGDTGL